MKSDEVYKKTKRQIQKDYNDALEEALRKNREYFKTVEKVQNGKIKPPVRIAYRCTDRSVDICGGMPKSPMQSILCWKNFNPLALRPAKMFCG